MLLLPALGFVSVLLLPRQFLIKRVQNFFHKVLKIIHLSFFWNVFTFLAFFLIGVGGFGASFSDIFSLDKTNTYQYHNFKPIILSSYLFIKKCKISGSFATFFLAGATFLLFLLTSTASDSILSAFPRLLSRFGV